MCYFMEAIKMEAVKRKKKGRPKTIYKTPGRKSKLTPELINEMEDLVKQGYTFRDCCAVLDINESTFYSWINKANELQEDGNKLAVSEKSLYLELTKSLKRADTERKNALKQKIERHGNKQWQALAWILERSYPQEFGKVEQEQQQQEPIEVRLVTSAKSNPDRLKRIEDSLDEY